jgi:hypothetical protein
MKSLNLPIAMAFVLTGQWAMSALATQDQNVAVEAIVSHARSYVAAKKWTPPPELESDKERYAGLFVADVLREAGAAPWQPVRAGASTKDPSASEWADPAFEIKGWTVVFAPDKAEELTARQILGLYRKPGDVVARINRVGIVLDERHTISVSPASGRVERSYWGFELPDATEYDSGAKFEQNAKAMATKFTVRRFTGAG